MTQGGFETGADFVAARVSFDIDSTGISNLRELSEELNRYRTSTEAASRTTGDFTKYLQQMTQLANQATEAQTNLINQLQRMADVQQSLMTGQGTQVSRGAPQGYVNPFSGMGGGNGAGTANRPPTISDASGYLAGMSQQDPRGYVNMQAARGNVRAGDLPATSPSDQDIAQHAQRHFNREKAQNDQAIRTADPYASGQRHMSSLTSGASQLISELGPGGSGMGVASMAAQGMMSLSGHLRKSAAATGGVKDGSAPMGTADDVAGMAGMLGGLKSFAGTGLGAASLGVGAAVGGMALFQQGGQAVQGLRSMGQTRGGDFQEGLGYEMAIRSMALNPFISTDQARQIVSQGLSSGYTGKEFDTVTQFMAPQPMDEPVLTPQGWARMKDITAGDYVIGSDGTPKLVLGVQDKGVLECFRVMFRDGSYARSSEDHLWVTSKSNKGFIARPLKEIRKKIHYTNPRTGIQTYIHAVPLVDPVHMARQNLPIDPYLLGLLLGDGDISASLDKGKIRLSCFEDEGYSITTPFGCIPMRNDRGYTFPANSGFPNASGKGRPVHPLKHHLHTLGLLGTNHKTKFIPRQYLESSVEDRVALLQGLIDTDGGIYRQDGVAACSVRFFNTNPALINGVAELVRSLGGIAKITWSDKPMPASWLKSGQKITPRSNMGTVSIIRLPEGITPARLARKAGNYAQTVNRRRVKYITDVIPDGECEMRCLLIDSADHLYVTRDFTLTHNTNLKDMNIQAAESMKMFKKNVSEGGQSAESLSGELGALKIASKTGYSSSQDLVSSYANTSAALIDAGVSGPAASRSAATTAVMFSDDASLKDIGGGLMASAASSPTIGAMLKNPNMSGVNLPASLSPRASMEALGGDPTAIINIMRFHARQYASSGRKDYAVDGFQMWLQRTFPGVGDFNSRTKVERLMTKLLSGENITGKAEQKMNASRDAQVKTRDATASFGSVVGGVAGGLGAMAETGWAGVQDFFGNLFNQEDGFSSGNPKWDRTKKAADEFTLATSDVRSKQLDIIAREHGIDNLQVGSGNNWKDFNPRDIEMVKALESGKMKIRNQQMGGPGVTLRESIDKGLDPSGGGGPNAFSVAPQNVNVGGTLKVTVEDNRQVQVDREVRLTPTQDAANEGLGGARHNNPTPGDQRRQRQYQ